MNMKEMMMKINDAELKVVNGGSDDLSNAPHKNCPYCMAEKGFIIYMECIGYSCSNNGEYHWGYIYRCPSCGRDAYFQMG